MEIPIKFPSDEEVIREEVARFRALSPEERIAMIRGILAAGALMIDRSSKADFIQAYSAQQNEIARRNIQEFVARHGG